MASACISSCVDDVRVPVRASYVNKWPESDIEFVRSMSSKTRRDDHVDIHTPRRPSKNSIYRGQPRVVDSISCRQLYLRSYTFSREEDHHSEEDDNSIKCLRRKSTVDKYNNNINTYKGSRKQRKYYSRDGGGLKKVKAVSCSALSSIFRGLMSCTTKVDVAN